MRLITHFEVASRSTSDLRYLLKAAFMAAADAAPCSRARRNALSSIVTIKSELARRGLRF